MRVLVTGISGQLGYDILKVLRANNINCLGTDRELLDLMNKASIEKVINEYEPTIVIHCAAYTAVDKAEDEKDLCYNVNVRGTEYIAEACKNINATLIYFSTDYVFDGKGNTPFEVNDHPQPINYYGMTKYEGELIVRELLENYFIIRISWVFGQNGNNFVKTMLRLSKTRNEINVVSDQCGSPTYTLDLANLILKLIKTNKYGTYHITNDGYCSWYEFTKEIFRIANIAVQVNPINSIEYPTKAIRPQNSKLSKQKLLDNQLTTLRPWELALESYISQLLIEKE